MKKTLIQRIEVTNPAGQASIEFTSIPATYTDLYLVFSLRDTSDTVAGLVTFNTSGGTYTRRRLQGSGSTVMSDTAGHDFTINVAGFTANTFGSGAIYIPNYTSSNAKSYSSDSVSETNSTASYQRLNAGLWSGTSAITSVTMEPLVGSWVQYSSATVYGITAGSDGTTTVS